MRNFDNLHNIIDRVCTSRTRYDTVDYANNIGWVLVFHSRKRVEKTFWPPSSSFARHKRYFSFACVLFWRKYILHFPSSFYLVPPNNVLGAPIDYFDRNYDLPFGFVEQTVDSKWTSHISCYPITLGDHLSKWTSIQVQDDVAGFYHYCWKYWSH